MLETIPRERVKRELRELYLTRCSESERVHFQIYLIPTLGVRGDKLTSVIMAIEVMTLFELEAALGYLRWLVNSELSEAVREIKLELGLW